MSVHKYNLSASSLTAYLNSIKINTEFSIDLAGIVLQCITVGG